MLIGWHPAGNVIGLWMMPVLCLIEPDVSFELAFVSRAQPRSKRYSLQKRGEEICRFATLLRYMNQTQRQHFNERGVPCLTQVRHANWLVSVFPAW